MSQFWNRCNLHASVIIVFEPDCLGKSVLWLEFQREGTLTTILVQQGLLGSLNLYDKTLSNAKS